MSEEIKEILDRLDFNEWEVDLYNVPITWCELYDVRDYINNLQQKVEQLENIRKEAIKWVNKHTTKFKDIYIPASESWYLLDILNKGSDKE